MALVTADEVKEIMDNLDLSDSIIETFIDAADIVIIKAYENDTTTTSAQKKEVERWLSAHFIASTLKRMGASEKVGEAEIKYIGKFGLGLDLTPYGQIAKQIDPAGVLNRMSKSDIMIKAIESFDD